MNENQLRSDAANYILDRVNREFGMFAVTCQLDAEEQLGFDTVDDNPKPVFLYFWVITLADDFHNTVGLTDRLQELSHQVFMQHGIFITFRLRRIVHDSDLIQDEES